MPTLSGVGRNRLGAAGGELFFIFAAAGQLATLPRMTTAEVLKACAEEAKLPFLVIGGYAVIAHGYQRTTADLDVLIRRRDLDAWINELAKMNYAPLHIHQTFARFKSSTGTIDLDVMLVNDDTFQKMSIEAKATEIEQIKVSVPSIEHLIALKLHALKQDLRHRRIGDADDIINLILRNGINLQESRWREIFEKHGTLEWYERIRKATQP